MKEKITRKTRAITLVHIFGNAADMDALAEFAEDHNLLIISDSAQAHGTEYRGRDVGSSDDLNCYSFYPTKSMTTGEGGLVTMNNEELDKLGRLIRSHGEDARYNHVILGLNYSMTDIAAVIGLNELSNLDRYLERRRYCARILREGVRKIDGLLPPEDRGGSQPILQLLLPRHGN